MSSDEEVIDEDRESAGVDVGDLPFPRALASAKERAERYEAAEAMGEEVDWEDRFLNMDVEDWGLFKAIGEGKGELNGMNDETVVTMNVEGDGEK